MYVQEALAQANASAYCARHGGSLITYRQAAKQVMVENYFDLGPRTDYYYWIGLKRTNATGPFEFTSGGSAGVPQFATNVPYAHWNWLYPGKRQYPYHCGVARYSTMYDWFVGDISTIAVSDYFVTGTSNTDRK